MKTLLLFFGLMLSNVLLAQDFLRFSGVVLDREQITPIDGTYIFNLSGNHEAVTDSLGLFSIEARSGDTLVFRDLRYQPSTLVVPSVLQASDYGIIQLLQPSAVLLNEVKVFSFPSEEEFREAFLKVAPKTDMESRALEAKRDLMKLLKDSYKNDIYYYDMWADRRLYELTGVVQPNHFLDPFRWTELIRSFGAKDK